MYTFRLQSVLDHRQIVEDNVKKELAQIRQQVAESQKKLEWLKQKEMETVQTLQQDQIQGLSSDGVLAYQAFLKNLSQRMIDQQKAIDRICAQEAAKKSELLEAMKKRQILEKLKEKGVAHYQQSIFKKEQAFIDEIAVNQFVRSSLTHNGEEE